MLLVVMLCLTHKVSDGLALWVAGGALIVKELLFRYMLSVANA